MLITFGSHPTIKHRVNLMNVTRLVGEKDGDNIKGKMHVNNGPTIDLNPEEYAEVCKFWDAHGERIRVNEPEAPATLPTPDGQEERDFNLGDE